LAPSPTGYLHLGHACTFWTAQERARAAGGKLVLRSEDLDRDRCKADFTEAMMEDLRWFGLEWDEGPDKGGPFAPYIQSQRQEFYLHAFEQLRASGVVYPCTCSRQDVLRALQAPHAGEDEPIYPGTCRPKQGPRSKVESCRLRQEQASPGSFKAQPSTRVNWRFHVPEGESISFVDGHYGLQQLVAGKDFGDFVIWQHDNVPAYQLAVVVDDAAMQITELVRGEDLLKSTARQLLLYRALNLKLPAFFHCPLLTDANGARLAKRHDALSLRALRQQGAIPEKLREGWAGP
jgi:glutamyl-tRNA synthetase